MKKLAVYLKLIRVYQWHKNLFVFSGFFVLGNYGNYELLLKSVYAFIMFCLVSSAVYIFNDYRDMESDSLHPLKSRRPLASGTVAVKHALAIAGLIGLISLTGSFLLLGVPALVIISCYLINNFAYSMFLKKYPIIDVFQIGIGFMLRIFAGTAGIGILISEWMILTGFMISLLIGFAKRYAEAVNQTRHEHKREVLQDYSLDTLKAFMIIMASATIITYSLYTLSPRSVELHKTTNLIYTIPFVMFGIFRFLYIVLFYQSGEDPSSQIFQDRQIVITGILWMITYGFMIY